MCYNCLAEELISKRDSIADSIEDYAVIVESIGVIEDSIAEEPFSDGARYLFSLLTNQVYESDEKLVSAFREFPALKKLVVELIEPTTVVLLKKVFIAGVLTCEHFESKFGLPKTVKQEDNKLKEIKERFIEKSNLQIEKIIADASAEDEGVETSSKHHDSGEAESFGMYL